ncbi:MAG: TolB family protein [Chloroflexota bacterium]
MRFGVSGLLVIVVVASLAFAQSSSYAADVDLGAPDRAPSQEISFIGPDGGVWLTPLGRGSMRLLLAQGEFTDYFWSPDGRRIAYLTSDGGLSVLDVVSGRRVRLSEPSVEEISWAPSGEQVLFMRGQHLWLISARGGGASRLTEWDPEDGDRLAQPLWSGDGRFVVYQMSRERGSRDLGVLEVKPRRTRTFPLAPNSGSVEAAAVSPDGRAVVIPHWQQGESAAAVCRRFGVPLTASASVASESGTFAQVIELVSFPNLERRALGCWSLSDSDAVTTGWLAPTFLREGQVALISAIDAPSGLVAMDRASGVIDPRTLNLVSLAEENGTIERRYPTEVVSNGRVAAVVYRQDELQAQGVWFSFELHLVDAAGDGPPRRDVILREGCFCPDDRADTNVTDLQLSADGSQVAFTYFKNGVNRVALSSAVGQITIVNDGQRPIWRPSE